MRFLRYALYRVLLLLPILFVCTFLTFWLTRVLPGDPLAVVLPKFTSPEERLLILEKSGLLRPLHNQFYDYLLALCQGDLGVSYATGRPVLLTFWNGFRRPRKLVLVSMALSMVIAIPLGMVSAIRENSGWDHFGRLVSVLGVSVPVYWLAMLLVYVFFFILSWAPGPMGRIGALISPPNRITGLYALDALVTGDWPTLRSVVAHLALPTLTLTFVTVAPIARITRSSMIEALHSNYVRAALCYGLPKRVVYFRIALKNSLLQIFTITAAVLGFSLGGVVLIEVIFSWPGLGTYAFDAILTQDYPAVQAFILVMTTIHVLIYLGLDLIAAALDPRVTF